MSSIFKNRRNNQSIEEKKQVNDNRVKNYALSQKIDEFIEWYYINFVKGHFTDIGEQHQPDHMRNIIEKMAVWYELRYPEYEVSRLYPGSAHEELFADEIYIYKNPAIRKMTNVLNVDERNNFYQAISLLKWEDLNSYQAYLSALPWEEKWFLIKPTFSDIDNIVYVNGSNHLHLDSNGIVSESKIIKAVNDCIEYHDLFGYQFENAIRYLKGINYPLNTEDRNIKILELRDRFFNAVMYRIIERGGVRIGSRRAFMFAREFNQNIDIPLTYALDTSDPGLRDFINEYLKAGGHTDLKCLVYYQYRKNDNEPLETISIQEIMKTLMANCIDKYTTEEKALQQTLANDLRTILETAKANDQTEQPRKLVLKPNNNK